MGPMAAMVFAFLVHRLPRSVDDGDLRWLSPLPALAHVRLHTLRCTAAGPGDDIGMRRLSDPPAGV